MSIDLVAASKGAVAISSDADTQIVDLWLCGRSPHTQRARSPGLVVEAGTA